MGPSFACSIWTILNANKETKQIVFIYRLFSCPGPSREHESKKKGQIFANVRAPQSMQNSFD